MINHNKAYILGLLTGGGRLDKETFIIELPFKKWGMEPQKMNIIAVDILQRISSLFNKEYSLNVTYEIGNNKWFIKPLDDENFDKIKIDLQKLNLPIVGFPLNTVDLTVCKENLKGINAESFLSGIFDSRASITLSHRRFNSEAPVVSIEIPGSTKNFKFVVQLCSWLTELGSITDQILYNHPNQHSSSDPTYKGWKKGFKIRFLIKSFLANHSFALQAKSIDAELIEKHQKKLEQEECPFRKIRKPSPVSVHNDMDSESLPIEVRNNLYFHYFHFCASIGCKFAPREEVKRIVKEKKNLISFFPRLSKGNIDEITDEFNSITTEYFNEYETSQNRLSSKSILSETSPFINYYGLEQGIAYLLSPKLNGKRHSGPMANILKEFSQIHLEIIHFVKLEDEPIMIFNKSNDRAIICSNISSKTNQKLILNKTETQGLDVKLI
jgi:hypothetical protein